ncbi:MAG TPA: ribosome-associated translation inhibitor RaiA [Chitinophagaceae bacterium]|nr:ribosome-associated translation inhibitor RaiA [Chitinophagaceae bacterium]
MQLLIESPGLKIEDQLLESIHARFDHFTRLYNRISKCRVLLRKEKSDHQDKYRIEAKLIVPGKVLFAQEQADNFETSLPKVVNGLMHQLSRYKNEREEIW